MFIARRVSTMDQKVQDAGQLRTPTPLTPRDIETRVLRICSEYDKIQETNKNNVRRTGNMIDSNTIVCVSMIFNGQIATYDHGINRDDLFY
jgi:hypothetical protein